MKSLAVYLVIVIFFFAGFEFFARKHFEPLLSLSDAMLFKVELLKNRGLNNVVLLGSSRFQDAINVKYLERWHKKNANKKGRFFDASFRGPVFEEYLFAVKEIIKLDNADSIVLEWSSAVFSDVPPAEGLYTKGIAKESGRVERFLQNSLHEYSDLVKIRRSIGLRSIHKIYMLYTSHHMTHDLWTSPRIPENYFKARYKHYDLKTLNKIQPAILKSKVNTEEQVLNVKLQRLRDVLKKTDKQVYFVMPPVIKEQREVSFDFKSSQQINLVLGKKDIFLDYSKSGFPKGLMRDDVHLNIEGENLFSQLLARDLNKYKVVKD